MLASVGVRYFTTDNDYHDEMGKIADIYTWYHGDAVEIHRSFVNPENQTDGSLYYTVHTVFEDVPSDIQEALVKQSKTEIGSMSWLNP